MIDDVMPLVSREACQHCPYRDDCETFEVYRCDKAQRLSDLRGMRDLMSTRYREYMVEEGDLDIGEWGLEDETAWYACFWRELDQLIKEANHDR